MGAAGSEHPQKHREKQSSSKSGAENGARTPLTTPTDPDLYRIAKVWGMLAPASRAAILRIIDDAGSVTS
jgi:hypothetical protein